MKRLIIFLFFIFSIESVSAMPNGLSTELKVMTFNIHHGASTENIVDLNAIAEVICSLQPDFVALQEVDKHTGRTFKKDIAAELGQKTGMNHLFRASMPFDGGFYGNAVLSRYPIIRGCRLDLPSNRDNEPRTAVEATIRLPNGNNILFVSTHLDHHTDTRDRKKQARALNRNLLPAQYPIILAGDFNDVPGSRPIRILEKKWKSTCRPDS